MAVWRARPRQSSRSSIGFYRWVPVRLTLRQYFSPARRFEQFLFRRGQTGSRTVANSFLVFTTLRSLARSTRRKSEVLAVDRLEPGERITIVSEHWPVRRARR